MLMVVGGNYCVLTAAEMPGWHKGIREGHSRTEGVMFV